MRYRKFDITNFKGIRATTLDLGKGPSSNVFTIVGLNESGKTTVLEALHWFYDPTYYNANDLVPKDREINFEDTVQVKALIELSKDDNIELAKYLLANHNFTLTDHIKTFDVARRWTYKDSLRQSNKSTWDVEFCGRTGRQRKIRKIEDASSPLWQGAVKFMREQLFSPIIYYENFLFEFPDKIYLDGPSLAENQDDKKYCDMLLDVFRSLGGNIDVRKHLIERHDSGDPAQKGRVETLLMRASAAITKVAADEWRKVAGASGATEHFKIKLGPIETDDGGHFIYIKVQQGGNSYSIADRSLGFRWFLAFVMFTHFRTFRDNARKNGLFLLDEPASNLHSTAQRRLMERFFSLPNDQIMIYSTHSHHLINPSWLAGAYIVTNGAGQHNGLDGATGAQDSDIGAFRYFDFASQNTTSDAVFQPILDALDYQPGALERVPDVVITEGKFDYFAFRWLAESGVLGTTFDLNFYPSTGKDNVHLVARLYLAWRRRFVAVFDGDAQTVKDALVEELGPVVDGRLLTLNDLNGAIIKATEHMFTAKDRDQVIEAVLGPGQVYTKKRFNVCLQQLWNERKTVPLETSTVKCGVLLFEQIQSCLGNQVVH